jgi:GntR family transcriptional regulator
MRTLDGLRLTINDKDKRPIYQQVADGIKALIARRELAEGKPLPSVRRLAADLGVNLNTIATAYRELRDEGLIAVRHGSGSVIAAARVSNRRDEDLRGPLRIALTELMLAGLSHSKILSLVNEELKGLEKD